VESRQAPDPVSPPGPDLSELLTLAGRGDQVAFETVYDRVAPAAFGLALRVLRDAAQAEEVAQEALLEVWRTAGRFDPALARTAC
jgi:RNA polymerase sigma-70 factor (ECF subfamily)